MLITDNACNVHDVTAWPSLPTDDRLTPDDGFTRVESRSRRGNKNGYSSALKVDTCITGGVITGRRHAIDRDGFISDDDGTDIADQNRDTAGDSCATTGNGRVTDNGNATPGCGCASTDNG